MSLPLLGALVMLGGLVLAIVAVAKDDLNNEAEMDPAWRALVIAFYISITGLAVLTGTAVYDLLEWLLQ